MTGDKRNIVLFREAVATAVTNSTFDLQAVVSALVGIYGFENIRDAVRDAPAHTYALNELVRQVCCCDDLIPNFEFVTSALSNEHPRIARLRKQRVFVLAAEEADEAAGTFREELGSELPEDAGYGARTTAETIAWIWKQRFDRAVSEIAKPRRAKG